MAELEISKIKFSNINTNQSVLGNGMKNTRTSFVSTDGNYSLEKLSKNLSLIEEGKTSWSNVSFINSIDIDWNGAELKNNSEVKATLNTTGESLSSPRNVM